MSIRPVTSLPIGSQSSSSSNAVVIDNPYLENIFKNPRDPRVDTWLDCVKKDPTVTAVMIDAVARNLIIDGKNVDVFFKMIKQLSPEASYEPLICSILHAAKNNQGGVIHQILNGIEEPTLVHAVFQAVMDEIHQFGDEQKWAAILSQPDSSIVSILKSKDFEWEKNISDWIEMAVENKHLGLVERWTRFHQTSSAKNLTSTTESSLI